MSDKQRPDLKSLAAAQDLLRDARAVLDEVRCYNDAGVDTAALRPVLLVLAMEMGALHEALVELQKCGDQIQEAASPTDAIQ